MDDRRQGRRSSLTCRGAGDHVALRRVLGCEPSPGASVMDDGAHTWSRVSLLVRAGRKPLDTFARVG